MTLSHHAAAFRWKQLYQAYHSRGRLSLNFSYRENSSTSCLAFW